MKDSDVAKQYSDFESSSSVDCRDYDCSDRSGCDSDTKYYPTVVLLILALELMSATVIPGFQSRLQLLKTMQMPFDPEMIFLDLLVHKLMLSGTWHTTQAGISRHLPSSKADSLKLLSKIQPWACLYGSGSRQRKPANPSILSTMLWLMPYSTRDIINTAVPWFATKLFKKKSPVILETASDEAIPSAMYQLNTAQTRLKDIKASHTSCQRIPMAKVRFKHLKKWQLLPITVHWNMVTSRSPWRHSLIKTKTGRYTHSGRKLTWIMMIASSPWNGKWAKRSESERGSIEMCDSTFNKVTVGLMDGLRTFIMLHPSEVKKNNALTLQHTERKYQGLQERTMIKDTGNPGCIVKLVLTTGITLFARDGN